jgi:hypothetical protein
MPLWEYSLVYGLTDGKGQERDFLDRWGSEGWELILIVPAGYRRYPDERPVFPIRNTASTISNGQDREAELSDAC